MERDQTDEMAEAARLLFARGAEFFWAAGASQQAAAAGAARDRLCRAFECRQILVINALTGRKALARTSNTPGRTQELNFLQHR